MTDVVQSLSPKEMGRQLGKPEGKAGLAVAELITRINVRITDDTLRSLDLQPGNRVLEVGFCNGHLTTELLARADRLTYAGIDI